MEQSIFSDIVQATGSLVEAVPTHETEADIHPIVHGLDSFSILCAAGIGYVGVAIMMVGAVKSIAQFVRYAGGGHMHLSHIRIELGKHLALGLEFFVGKDIIESVVSPSWNDLGKLGAIVALRTVLTIFLSKELKEVEQEMTVEKMEREMDAPVAKKRT